MAKKKQIKEKPIPAVAGWVLITRYEDTESRRTGPWHVAWWEVFGTKGAAVAFAQSNNWSMPYRAVRGSIGVTP